MKINKIISLLSLFLIFLSCEKKDDLAPVNLVCECYETTGGTCVDAPRYGSPGEEITCCSKIHSTRLNKTPWAVEEGEMEILNVTNIRRDDYILSFAKVRLKNNFKGGIIMAGNENEGNATIGILLRE